MGRPRKHTDNAAKQRAYRQNKTRELRNAEALQNERTGPQVDRPVLRYYGSKWAVADWVMSYFPVHKCYVEPFAGGASVLLQKSPSKHEVLNDLDSEVINFFDQLRDNTAALVRAIHLTPFAREELRRAAQPCPGTDRLERARRFYVRCWQSFGSGTSRWSTGWRFQVGRTEDDRASAVGSFNKIDHLWVVAERLKLVQIEHDDAFKVVRRFDGRDTLFYVDPPYVHATRYDPAKGYAHEMSDVDHRHLAELLHSVSGMVILSGYPSVLYDEIFGDWLRVQKRTRNQLGGPETECLWLSPRIQELTRLPLFTGLSGGVVENA